MSSPTGAGLLTLCRAGLVLVYGDLNLLDRTQSAVSRFYRFDAYKAPKRIERAERLKIVYVESTFDLTALIGYLHTSRYDYIGVYGLDALLVSEGLFSAQSCSRILAGLVDVTRTMNANLIINDVLEQQDIRLLDDVEHLKSLTVPYHDVLKRFIRYSWTIDHNGIEAGTWTCLHTGRKYDVTWSTTLAGNAQDIVIS